MAHDDLYGVSSFHVILTIVWFITFGTSPCLSYFPIKSSESVFIFYDAMLKSYVLECNFYQPLASFNWIGDHAVFLDEFKIKISYYLFSWFLKLVSSFLPDVMLNLFNIIAVICCLIGFRRSLLFLNSDTLHLEWITVLDCWFLVVFRGFKALKQTVKLYYKLGRYKEMMDAYRDMLTYIKSAVTRNYSEKCINNIMDFISGSAGQNFSLLQEFYQTTLKALEEAKNEVKSLFGLN